MVRTETTTVVLTLTLAIPVTSYSMARRDKYLIRRPLSERDNVQVHYSLLHMGGQGTLYVGGI